MPKKEAKKLNSRVCLCEWKMIKMWKCKHNSTYEWILTTLTMWIFIPYQHCYIMYTISTHVPKKSSFSAIKSSKQWTYQQESTIYDDNQQVSQSHTRAVAAAERGGICASQKILFLFLFHIFQFHIFSATENIFYVLYMSSSSSTNTHSHPPNHQHSQCMCLSMYVCMCVCVCVCVCAAHLMWMGMEKYTKCDVCFPSSSFWLHVLCCAAFFFAFLLFFSSRAPLHRQFHPNTAI